MKRSLVSLAAMAAAGAARPTMVSLFGVAEAPATTMRAPRIGPLLNDPDPSGIEAIRAAIAEEIVRAHVAAGPGPLMVPGQRVGNTMRLHPWQEDAITMMRAHATTPLAWPAGWGNGLP